MRLLNTKLLLSVISIALLAACQQADTARLTQAHKASDLQSVSYASAVPEVIELKRCARKSDGVVISSATLSLTANGDMIFSGALQSGVPAELARINFTEMSMRTVSASATSSRGNTLSASTADNRTMAFYTTRHGYFVYTSPAVNYSCEPVTTASMLSTSSRPASL